MPLVTPENTPKHDQSLYKHDTGVLDVWDFSTARRSALGSLCRSGVDALVWRVRLVYDVCVHGQVTAHAGNGIDGDN